MTSIQNGESRNEILPETETNEPLWEQGLPQDPPEVVNDTEMEMKMGTESNERSDMYLEEYFRDHFTLSTPSSLVRFRSNTCVRVFDDGAMQFILEETVDVDASNNPKRRIHVKRLYDGTRGLQFLRFLYTTMCVFWTGIFFSLCLQVILVMVLEMAVATGLTELASGLHVLNLVG